MRKTTAKLFAAIFLTAAFMAFASPVFAAGASISAPGEVKVGDTFTISVTFTGENIMGVNAVLSYDAGVFESSGSSGSIKLVDTSSSTGQSSLAFSVSLKAINAGSGSVSVSAGDDDIVGFDGTNKFSLGGASASKKIKVVSDEPAPATPTPETPSPSSAATPAPQPPSPSPEATAESPSASPSPSPSDSKTPKPSASKTPEPTPTPDVKIDIDGTIMTAALSMKDVDAPSGFEKSSLDIPEGRVASLVNGDTVLVYLKKPDGSGALYIYTDGKYIPYTELSTEAKRYMFLPSDSTPEGFKEAELVIDSASVNAWKHEDDDDGTYLVYITEIGKNEPFFATYDSTDGTVMRYYERVKVTENVVEVTVPVPTEIIKEVIITPKPAPEESPKPLVERITGDSGILAVVAGLIGLAIILITVLIVVAAMKGKNGKNGGGGSAGGKHEKSSAGRYAASPEESGSPSRRRIPPGTQI